jgi:uncharacterized protein YjbJ (UPF0337 family)
MLDQGKGMLQNASGKVQDAVGGLTGDSAMQLKGKARAAAGQIQQTYGDTLDSVRDMTASTPIAALAIAVGAGFVLGALLTRN